MDATGVSPLVRARAPNRTVLAQHVEDAAVLRNTRSWLTRAPHVKLHLLRRLDDRLAAHLDGLEIGAAHGAAMANAALDGAGRGQLFTAAVAAIGQRAPAALDKVLRVAEALPDHQGGAISAFGWVSAASLSGITRAMLDSPSPFRRQVGLAACAMHQVDPGAAVIAAAAGDDAPLRARALRVIGERGLVHAMRTCLEALADDDPGCVFAAARAALLLGDRGAALAALDALAARPGAYRAAALALTLKVHPLSRAQALLGDMASDAEPPARLLIQAIGIAGDPQHVPWLLAQMDTPRLARISGEAFSLMTGADLAERDLERKPPQSGQAGPNDDVQDEDVAQDKDEGLPWPDPDKMAHWWAAQGGRFPPGARCLAGAPPTPAHCLSVLRTGYQRQRIAAAEWLCLLQPGTPLFPTAAPAWRQQRWLDRMDR